MATYARYWWNRAETDDKHYIHQMESVHQIVETSEVRLRRSVQAKALSILQQREQNEDKQELGLGKRSTNVGAMNRLAMVCTRVCFPGTRSSRHMPTMILTLGHLCRTQLFVYG